MKKEKIVLTDSTEIEIENGAIENCVQVIIYDLNDFKGLYDKFSENNLEEYKILNSDGLCCANIKNKYLQKASIEPYESGFLISLHLADVDMVAKRLNALEMGQELQDGAISDLGNVISDIAEGGEI